MKKLYTLILSGIIIAFTFSSCKKDKDTQPDNTVQSHRVTKVVMVNGPDSSTMTFTYENDKIKTVTTLDNGTNVQKHIFEYTGANYRIDQYNWGNDNWMIDTSYYETVTHLNGKLNEYKEFESSLPYTSKTTFTWNGELLEKSQMWRTINTVSALHGEAKYAYDGGNLITEEDYENGNLQSKMAFTYDAGKVSIIEMYDNEGNLYGKSIYQYSGNKIEKSDNYVVFEGQSILGSVSRYTYDGVLLINMRMESPDGSQVLASETWTWEAGTGDLKDYWTANGGWAFIKAFGTDFPMIVKKK